MTRFLDPIFSVYREYFNLYNKYVFEKVIEYDRK